MPQNQVKINVDVKTNAPEKFKEVSDSVRLAERFAVSAREGYENYAEALDTAKKSAQAFIGPCTQLTQSVQKANQEAAKFPSAMMKAALAAQELKIGYVEGLGDMAEETLSFGEVLRRAQLYMEDVAFSVGKVLEGVNKEFNSKFTEQASFTLEAGKRTFNDLHKSLDDGLSGVFATSFTATTKETHEAWEKFLKQMEASFYQSLGRMASALVQENLLAPAFKLGQEAAGALLSAGKNLLGLAEGALVTKPTLALVGEAGPEVVLPVAA